MPFNLLNSSASASILYGQIFLLHPFQSAQESCIIVSISRSVIVSIASILSGQIFLLHSLQAAQEFWNVSISLWPDLHIASSSICSRILHCCFNCFNSLLPDLSNCIPFNLLKNPALLFQFLYCQIFQIALTSILLKNPALLFQFLYGQIFHTAFNFNLLKNFALFLFLYGQIFILHARQSAQEPLHLLQIFYGQIFLLHPLQSICSRILHCFKV